MTHYPLGDEPPAPFIRDRLTLLTYGMAIVSGFGVAALGPAMPSLRDTLSINRTLGGLHFTALAVGGILAGITVERITRARGRRWVFWWGGAGVAVGCLVIGLGANPATTLAGSLLVGTSGTAMLSVSQAMLSDHHPHDRAVALTEIHTAASVGTILPALLIGLVLATGVGWRSAFLAPALAWALLAAVGRTEAFPRPHHMDGSRRRRRLPRAYWLFWAAIIPSVGAEWSIGAWGAGYLVEVAGASDASASLLMVAFFGAIATGRFIGARIARIVAAYPLLVGATVIALAGVLLFWGSRSIVPVVAGLFVAGLGISVAFPLLMSLAIGTAPDRSDTASARMFIAAGGSVAVAPVVLGAVADQVGIRPAFALVPGLFGLLIVLATLGVRADARESTIGSTTA